MIHKSHRSTHYLISVGGDIDGVSSVTWMRAQKIGADLLLLAENIADCINIPAAELALTTTQIFEGTNFDPAYSFDSARFYRASKRAYSTKQSLHVLEPVEQNGALRPLQLHLSFLEKKDRVPFYEIILIFGYNAEIIMYRLSGVGLGTTVGWNSGITPYPQIVTGFPRPKK